MKKFFTLLLTTLLTFATTAATELWTGSSTIGNWSGSEVKVEKESFSTAAAGNIIRLTISSYQEKNGNNDVTSWSYQLQQKDNGWNTLTDFTEGDLRKGQKCVSYILTENDVTALKAYGLVVNGAWITITKVELLTSTEPISLSTTSKQAETLGNWFNDELTWDNKGALANAQKFDCIRVTYTVLASGAQLNVNTVQGDWVTRAYKYDNSYDAEGANTGKVLTCNISDATILEMVQQAGVAISGVNVEITAIDLIKPEDRVDVVPLTIGTDEIASFGSSKHLDFTGTGVTPYYVTAVTNGSVTLTSTDKTRAWSGCIVKGEAGEYEIPVTSEVSWQDCMKYLQSSGEGGAWVYRSAYDDYSGTDDNATKIKTYYRYIFAKDGEGTPAFYKLSESYSRTKDETTVYYHELAAHKAYLETSTDIAPAPASQGTAPAIHLVFEEENNATALDSSAEANRCVKVIQNGRLLIIKDGITYDLTGNVVR